jgi:hypothetical protein
MKKSTNSRTKILDPRLLRDDPMPPRTRILLYVSAALAIAALVVIGYGAFWA